MMDNETRKDLVSSVDTDKHPVVRPVSYDMCARINSLINPRWSSITLYIKTKETQYYARVRSVVPSPSPGYIIVDCDTVMHGRLLLECGAGISFDMRIQTS